MIRNLIPTLLIGALSVLNAQAALPKLNESFESARAWTQGDALAVTTGLVAREFLWTGKGLVTVGLKDLKSDKVWADDALNNPDADWDFPGLTEGAATLLSLTATNSTDEGFTSEHLEVVAEMEYPETGVSLKYVIWAYPDMPGLRTQVWLQGEPREVTGSTVVGGGVSLAVAKGNAHQIPASAKESKVGQPYHLTNVYASKMVELKMEGMQHDRSYKAMASWWDTGRHGRRTQSIDALSMDAESRVTVVPAVALPSARDGKLAGNVAFDIPDSVRVGDTVRLQFNHKQGVNVNVSELWLYESGAILRTR